MLNEAYRRGGRGGGEAWGGVLPGHQTRPLNPNSVTKPPTRPLNPQPGHYTPNPVTKPPTRSLNPQPGH